MLKSVLFLAISFQITEASIAFAEDQSTAQAATASAPSGAASDAPPAADSSASKVHPIERFYDKAIGPLLTMDRNNPIYKQWEKFKIDFEVKTPAQIYNLDIADQQPISIGFGLKYGYTVEPAFVQNYHQRLDRYILDASMGTYFPFLNELLISTGLHASVNATVTFARLFDNKFEATFKAPYFLNRIPWKSETALNSLVPGDVARLDLTLNGYAGLGRGQDFSNGIIGVLGAGVRSSTNTVLDVYRMKEKLVRTRLLVARTKVAVDLNATVVYNKALDLSIGMLSKIFNKVLKFNPATIGTSFNLSDRLGTDTLMLDYIFNFEHQSAIDAYNELLEKFYKLKFVYHLNSLLNDDFVGEQLENEFKNTENLFLQSKSLIAAERPVDRIFKGRSRMTMWSYFFDSRVSAIFKLFAKNSTTISTLSFVKGFDRDDKAADFIYTNDNNFSSFNAVGTFFNTIEMTSLQSLFPAQRTNDRMSDIDVIPQKFTDLVFDRNIMDSKLSSSQIERMQDYLRKSAPEAAKRINWSQFSSPKSLTNGYINSRIVFREALINSLAGKYSIADISNKLQEIVDKLSKNNWIPEANESQCKANDPHYPCGGKFVEDIAYISQYLSVLLNSANAQSKLNALIIIRRIPLFQEVGAELITKLLANDQHENLMYVSVNAASSKVPLMAFTYGKESTSPVYQTLQYMIGLMNDRTFDLRVQLDQEENYKIYKFNNPYLSNCKDNCDTSVPLKQNKQ